MINTHNRHRSFPVSQWI